MYKHANKSFLFEGLIPELQLFYFAWYNFFHKFGVLTVYCMCITYKLQRLRTLVCLLCQS